MWPSVYFFTTGGCTSRIRCWQYWCGARIEFSHPKPSDLMLHVVPIVWGTLLGRGLWFVQERCTSKLMKKPNLVCVWTNKIVENRSTDIQFDPSCLEQAQSHRSGTGYGYENTELGCTLSTPSSIFNLSTGKAECLVCQNYWVSINYRYSFQSVSKFYFFRYFHLICFIVQIFSFLTLNAQKDRTVLFKKRAYY